MTDSKWSTEQTFHGGQDWNTSNFVEDFSVTCNSLGYARRGAARQRSNRH